MHWRISIFTIFIVFAHDCVADEVCVYRGSGGRNVVVSDRSKIPVSYQKTAQCMQSSARSSGGVNLAQPKDIDLSGNTRREKISSPLGLIELRWPRKVETLFGRTPVRAVTEATRIVSRTLKQNPFPPQVQNLNTSWDIIFMDENLPEKQIPRNLISNCHPGWMTPPTNIYIVADRVAAGCSGRKVSLSQADSSLTDVLVHEIGHAIEYQLLKNMFGSDRMRAEGFATWFEQFAADRSTLLDRNSLRRQQFTLAKISLKTPSTAYRFGGTATDYGRASLVFHLLEKRKGIRGILETYRLMERDRIPVSDAAKMVLHLRGNELDAEYKKLVGN